MAESVLIDGVRYVREREPSEIKILVLQRGWVVVGRITREGSQVVFSGGHVVRRWGTTAGIGQLAKEGPLPDTVLDQYERGSCHELAIVVEFDCEVGRWSQHIR